MDDRDTHPEAVTHVRARRICTGKRRKDPVDEDVCVVGETAVTIDVDGVESFTVLCTPTDRLAMAAGFLFTEGVVEHREDIKSLKECDDDANTIRVGLAESALGRRLDDSGRNLLIVSSCGACGSENLSERISALPVVGNSFQIDAEVLRSVYTALAGHQPLFNASGGAHAAAVFDASGAILASAEDAGRHNALDKAVGKCLLSDTSTTGVGVALTSRLSLEMVGKCARTGVELIAAVSAPTSLAIDVAQQCNITLCAFVRETRATVFTYPKRITR
ncbi:MAG: formate dehydrogenase accessory sulfurtransferase FdhD [Candidatus Latescibacterota bacterium]|nr:MAG: formate dehydrogenase accessory sulfurtransferase FdhD [Candidatus Latescibacterota bacterium]